MALKRKDTLGNIVAVINFVFFFVCCILIGVGVWILLDRNHISVLFGGSRLLSVGVIIVVTSLCCLTCITVLGCFGARRQHKCMLMTYFLLVLVIFLSFVIGGTTLLVYQTQLDTQLKDYMSETLRRYYGVELEDHYHRKVTYAWDRVQETFGCCAVDDYGWYMYRQSDWYVQQPHDDKTFVPESCCKDRDNLDALKRCQYNTVGPPGGNISLYNDELYYSGCYNKAVDWAVISASIFVAVSLGFAAFLVLTLIFTVTLYRYISE